MLEFPTPKLFNSQYQDLKLDPLKFVPASASIKSTCEYLQKFCHIGISSHSDPAQPSAIVTFMDIVRYVIPRFKQHKNDCIMDPIEYVLTLNPADESYLVWQVGAQDVLKDAFAQFCKGVHHGMVYDGPQKPRLLISQKGILEYVLGLDEWQQVLNESISKWLPFKELESESKLIECRAALPTINAFEELIATNLPALPVVENGSIIGILESKSIIDLKPNHLQKPVKEFLKVCKSKSVTINPSDSAKDVISLMLKDAESRVWCLGKNKVITGCVSKSDIIGAIAGVVPSSPGK